MQKRLKKPGQLFNTADNIMTQSLSKSTLLVSSLTLVSRLLGFVRDMLIAHYFGVNAATDAFFAAFRFPNFLRRLFAEGSFAQAFVPLLSEHKDENLQSLINKISGHLALLLAILTLIGMIAAPVLIMLCAAGFEWQSEQHILATRLLQIMFPYGFFVTLVAFFGSILNAHTKFAIPAFTPALLNLSMIGATIWLAPTFSKPIFALALGVLLGGIIQLLFQIPALWRLKLIPRFQLDFQDVAVKRVMKNLVPTIFATSATQINLLINTFLASFLVTGSVSWLYYADRLLEFPIGILGSGLATVMLPKLAKSHSKQDATNFSATIDWGLRWVILLGIPATIGLVFLAEPILSMLFQSAEFTASDVHASAQSLQGYAFGLVGFLVIKILMPAFSTQQLQRKAVRYAWMSLLGNLILAASLVTSFAHVGIALATGLSAILNANFLLFFLLRNRLYSPLNGWIFFLLKIVFASGVMIRALCYFYPTSTWTLIQCVLISGLSYLSSWWLMSKITTKWEN
jgi:putative peptidoglycan lipid II flippase